jgi:hypothetical protein
LLLGKGEKGDNRDSASKNFQNGTFSAPVKALCDQEKNQHVFPVLPEDLEEISANCNDVSGSRTAETDSVVEAYVGRAAFCQNFSTLTCGEPTQAEFTSGRISEVRPTSVFGLFIYVVYVHLRKASCRGLRIYVIYVST